MNRVSGAIIVVLLGIVAFQAWETQDEDGGERIRRVRTATGVQPAAAPEHAAPTGGRTKAPPITPSVEAQALIHPTPLSTRLPPVTAVRAPATPPNVVLMLGCTVRKDQVTPYGGEPDTTPFLARMADRGTLFDDAIAAAPWTRAASASILTGFHAVSIGMVEPGSGRDDYRVPETVSTLAEHLQARGYYTIGATANPNLADRFGFQQGFDAYQPGLPGDWSASSGAQIADAVLATLRTNRGTGDKRPFYLRTMMIEAHSPRGATGALLDPHRDGDVPEHIAQYRFHLHNVDSAIKHLVDGLASMGFDESNTLFMFIADHGEGMNYPRHHGYSHGQYMMPSTNHVPWIMAGPGVAAGHRVLGVASQTDVVPTVLGLIGRPLPDPTSVEGTDQSSLVRGDGHVTAYRQVWSDTWFQESNRAAVFTPTRQCQDDFGSTQRQKSKGLFVPGCYDRMGDPLLTTAVADEGLMGELRAWRHEREAHLSSVQAEKVQIDEATSRQLQALGYRD